MGMTEFGWSHAIDTTASAGELLSVRTFLPWSSMTVDSQPVALDWPATIAIDACGTVVERADQAVQLFAISSRTENCHGVASSTPLIVQRSGPSMVQALSAG